MDDVIKLISTKYEQDDYGNEVPIRTARQVFVSVSSITRTEFYQAAQNDLHPEYTFTISHYKDYLGEREVAYTDWRGEERIYDVIRTYRQPNTDSIELTVTERTADHGQGHISSNERHPCEICQGS